MANQKGNTKIGKACFPCSFHLTSRTRHYYLYLFLFLFFSRNYPVCRRWMLEKHVYPIHAFFVLFLFALFLFVYWVDFIFFYFVVLFFKDIFTVVLCGGWNWWCCWMHWKEISRKLHFFSFFFVSYLTWNGQVICDNNKVMEKIVIYFKNTLLFVKLRSAHGL